MKVLRSKMKSPFGVLISRSCVQPKYFAFTVFMKSSSLWQISREKSDLL